MPEAETASEIDLFDTAALRAVEQRSAAASGDPFELMRRAGQAAWRTVLERWPQAYRLLVICGPGNNGGDGFVLATHAIESGREVRVVQLPGHEPQRDPARLAFERFLSAGGSVQPFGAPLPPADLVVDALFGIGLSRAPDGDAASLVEAINAHQAPIFALDVPSGIDADLGSAPGAAVRASLTLEFLGCKPGLRTGTALDHVGSLELASLESESAFEGAEPAAGMLMPSALARWLHVRKRDTHKGRNGRVLCIGGELGGGGAVLLCAQAALRCGAGLVDVVSRPAHVTAVLARLPEAMVTGCDVPGDAVPRIDACDVVAIGPGLGQTQWAQALFERALAAGKPLVLDADALNLLAQRPVTLPADAVITPHPGEAARLLGTGIAEVQRDRRGCAQALVHRFGCTVVLKGAGTLVAAPGLPVSVIGAGNPGMAVGGMGDVLTGVVAALRAQGLDAASAATSGALLHSAAGDRAACEGERGLLPSDLMPHLRRLANPDQASRNTR